MARPKYDEPKQVKITDEIRAKLHGFAMVSSNITLPYKVEIDGVPDEFLPIITVMTLTVTEMEELRDKQFTTENEEYFAELTRTHIVGWKNLYDISTNTLVEFKADKGVNGGCDVDMFKKLPNKLKIDIITYITTVSAK
jgi:hypothetical protein